MLAAQCRLMRVSTSERCLWHPLWRMQVSREPPSRELQCVCLWRIGGRGGENIAVRREGENVGRMMTGWNLLLFIFWTGQQLLWIYWVIMRHEYFTDGCIGLRVPNMTNVTLRFILGFAFLSLRFATYAYYFGYRRAGKH